ncbi:MAG: radical SAM protein [Prevotella sp.]|nr:radical SAM protein [Prevotella sp.]
MEAKEFRLEKYLTEGVENIVKGALRASLSNPKESIFMTKFALNSRKASKKRKEAEEKGKHIPPFLIASITNACNLHCVGCYSKAVNSRNEKKEKDFLKSEDWEKIFLEASSLGISFILLAGGEPLLKEDVILKAAGVTSILFPVFTNGVMLKEKYLRGFDKNRNLIPVLSIEGNEETTDRRRGQGVYTMLKKTMEHLQKKGILFGASVTVTTRNIEEIFSLDFIDFLYQRGCKLVIYVEYVPMNEITKSLAPRVSEREYIEERLSFLRSKKEDIVFISFPGDEKTSGGCLAAGRGFFHINSFGEAEPCPFSPYSDINVKDVGLSKALESKMFLSLRNSGILTEDHDGGCVLFRKDEEIKKLAASSMS